ncbi:MAG: family 43 glycosylhydrolase [Planctomycetota bacterium]
MKLAVVALLASIGTVSLATAQNQDENQDQDTRPTPVAERKPIVVFDFEADDALKKWTIKGKAFGTGPTNGALASQRPLAGFLGKGLINSFHGGDKATGEATSPQFKIARRYLRLQVGGGNRPDVFVRLLVDGKPVRAAAGRDRELLEMQVWNLSEFQGKAARLHLVDKSDGGWGHLLLDHVVLADDPTGPALSLGVYTKIYDPSVGEKERWGFNDHCFVHGKGDLWHLIGITFTEPLVPAHDGQELGHATSKVLMQANWKKQPHALRVDVKKGEIHLWAPHIIRHAGRFWMFYCGGDTDLTAYRICLATSSDLKRWRRYHGNPLFQDGFQARDPFVMRVGAQWVMYYTATEPAKGGNHVVKYRTSRDLIEWSKAAGIVFRDPARGKGYGPTESPFIVQRGDTYYLFVGPRGNYVTTAVFSSKDPFNFSPQQKVAVLHAHAPEVVQDRDGRWYLSSCGFGKGGVYLAPLYWRDEP